MNSRSVCRRINQQSECHMPISWAENLSESAYHQASVLCRLVANMRKDGKRIFPSQENIFRALEQVTPQEVKVVILGQDPYHEIGQANGLAFAVDTDTCWPPSLRNIAKEIEAEYDVQLPPSWGSLLGAAKQGVLFLNSVLTVEEGHAASHKKLGWQEVTTDILRVVVEKNPNVVFACFGKDAIAIYDGVCESSVCRPYCLQTTHPSPLSANRRAGSIPAFIGSGVFRGVNNILTAHQQSEIDWTKNLENSV